MSNLQPTNETPQFLQRVIQKCIEVEAEKLITEAKKKLEERTPEIIAGVTVDVMKMVQMEDYKDRVIFTIKKNENN